MARSLIVALGTVAILGVAATAVGYAHIHNNQFEQQRRTALVESASSLLPADQERGRIVARAGGCIACHTDTENNGKLLAGGVELDSPFGTFVSPNITSDTVSGIGSWTQAMLSDALVNGRRPDGAHYWPAFPYDAYAAITNQDIADLFTWLQSSDPVSEPAKEHKLLIPDAARLAMGVWKALYVPNDYLPGSFQERGEYLVEGPAHCASCHAPRNLLGGVPDRRLTGNRRGPSGSVVPAITANALEDWTQEDLVFFLEVGMTPSGDFSGGHMVRVIEQGTAHLPIADLEAMSTYLKSPANQ